MKQLETPENLLAPDSPPGFPLDIPNIRIHLAIDLGLPSDTKWASCNVGASRPEDYGSYFAWGETDEKDDYTWSNYRHCNGTEQTCNTLGCISGSHNDAARIRWGGRWQLPSIEQFNELIDHTTYEWEELNGVSGGRFTGVNGNSIFLPSAGGRYDSNLYLDGSHGLYWSGMEGAYHDAFCLHFDALYADWCKNNWYRNVGLSVRPVLCKPLRIPMDTHRNPSPQF